MGHSWVFGFLAHISECSSSKMVGEVALLLLTYLFPLSWELWMWHITQCCRKVRYDARHLPSHTTQARDWSAAAISSTVHKATPSYTSSWMPHAGVSGAVSPTRASVRMLPRVPGFAPARAVPNEHMQSLEQQLAASQQHSSLEKSIFYCTCQHLPCPSQPWTLLSGKSCT